MNEKTKNILKIFGIYYLISFVIMLIMILSVSFAYPIGTKDLVQTIVVCLAVPISNILFIALFLPAIIVLYFLFKKFKGTKTRIFLTAFLIPFSNMLYYFIEYFITSSSEPMVSMFVGFYSIVFLLPLLLFTILFIPKSLLLFKKEAIKTLSLMFLFGWILIFISFVGLRYIDDMIDTSGLKKYESIIEQIEQYKKENNIYPNNVENNITSDKYKYFNYQTLNDNNDYILTIATHKNSIAQYRHCSNECFEGCHEGFYDYQSHRKIGKWIKAIIDD